MSIKKTQIADSITGSNNTPNSEQSISKKKQGATKQQLLNPTLLRAPSLQTTPGLSYQKQSDQETAQQQNQFCSVLPSEEREGTKLVIQDISEIAAKQQPIKKKLKGILFKDHGIIGNIELNKKITSKASGVQNKRKDHFGMVIGRGFGNTHRILFADAIEEVHDVENWKEYNLIEPPNTCPFRCSILQANSFAIFAQ